MKKDILILRYGAIGDTLLLRPLVKYLQRQNPRARFYLAGRPERMTLLAGLCGDDFSVIDFDRHFSWLYAEGGRPDQEIEDLLCNSEKAIFFTARPEGPAAANLKKWAGETLRTGQALPPEDYPKHCALFYFDQAGIPFSSEQLIEETEHRLISSCTDDAWEQTVILAPGAGSRMKRRPLDLWMQIIDGILGHCHVSIKILLGPAEDNLEFDTLLKRAPDRISLLRKPLSGLRKEIISARLYIGHDSGITHLAAMQGVPALALFGSTHPFQWGPLGIRTEVIWQGNRYRFPQWLQAECRGEKIKSAENELTAILDFALSYLKA